MGRLCRAKQALFNGLRPSPHNKILCGVCPTCCIYCDIWKLATLICTRVSLSSRWSTTPSRLQGLLPHPSYSFERSEKMIEAQFSTQKARLSSIMSICTVQGAEESGGLRLAYDRCHKSIEDLLYQERILEEALIRPAYHPQSFANRISRDCSATTGSCSSPLFDEGRRPSLVGMIA